MTIMVAVVMLRNIPEKRPDKVASEVGRLFSIGLGAGHR
jgi:hypothetical protein